MNHRMSHFLGAWPELQDRDEFGLCITGNPDPDILLRLFDIRPQFIELYMAEFQIGEKALL